jgi:threonine dehydrogenase-like Zn-dependent dehydrogenase
LQAQYVRVPFADFNGLKLPPGTEHEASFALLADIFPTGWHGLTLSKFSPGESVAVFGAGPVGLMAAYSAYLRGASRIYVVDKVPERLTASKKIPGAIPIDFSAGDAVKMIIKENGDKEVDRSVDAVGYQAVGSGEGEGEVPNVVLEQCIKVTRPTGGIGVPGLYVPSDPGAPDEKSARGMMMMSFGKLFEKARPYSYNIVAY